ncbi:MAG TPA: hypothetical protein VK434_21485 [Microvirga sp.]|jgi:hypothetical protein|nr:hypothetical protein [Microvirga sp.]
MSETLILQGVLMVLLAVWSEPVSELDSLPAGKFPGKRHRKSGPNILSEPKIPASAATYNLASNTMSRELRLLRQGSGTYTQASHGE